MINEYVFQQGTEARFQIQINQEGFNIEEDFFDIKLMYGIRQKVITIKKDDCIKNGVFIFNFDTSDIIGRVVATCTFKVFDSTTPDGHTTYVDRQILCYVTTSPICQHECSIPSMCDHAVTYTRYTDVEQDYDFSKDFNNDFSA